MICRQTLPTKKVLKVLSKVNKRESKEPIIDSIVSAAAAAGETHLFYKEKVNRFIHQSKQRPRIFYKLEGTFITVTIHHCYQEDN